jgi:hypothetical protein
LVPNTRNCENCWVTPAEGYRRHQANEEGKMDWNVLFSIGVIAVIVLLVGGVRGLGGG